MIQQTTLALADEPVPTEAEKWRARLRVYLLRHYRGQTVTTDECWRAASTKPGLALPASVHPNALGPLFSTWDRAKPVMIGDGIHRQQMTRVSERPEARRNRLGVWRIE